MDGTAKREKGNVVTTCNGTYIYNGEKWELMTLSDVIQLSVIDRGHILGRGYYTVVDNSENIPIDLCSTIRKGTSNISIKGIEKTNGATGVQSRWGLITNEKTVGDILTIDLAGNRLLNNL